MVTSSVLDNLPFNYHLNIIHFFHFNMVTVKWVTCILRLINMVTQIISYLTTYVFFSHPFFHFNMVLPFEHYPFFHFNMVTVCFLRLINMVTQIISYLTTYVFFSYPFFSFQYGHSQVVTCFLRLMQYGHLDNTYFSHPFFHFNMVLPFEHHLNIIHLVTVRFFHFNMVVIHFFSYHITI